MNRMNPPDSRWEHGPLTVREEVELLELMAAIRPQYQQAIQSGANCLPSHLRARAKLDWCRRWVKGRR